MYVRCFPVVYCRGYYHLIFKNQPPKDRNPPYKRAVLKNFNLPNRLSLFCTYNLYNIYITEDKTFARFSVFNI